MQPDMYGELASWWPLLSAPADYAEEAEIFRSAFEGASTQPAHSLLELGSGGGNNASHLKAHYNLTLVDRSPHMLAVSRQLNPECEHIEGDMRTLRLQRLFDLVFIHDAIAYMTTAADLRRALTTAYVHCRSGGVTIVVPDCVRETYRPQTIHGGHEGAQRGLRYLEWSWDPDPEDDVYCVDYAYLLRDEQGQVEVRHDRHINGLFPRQLWLDTLHEIGFEASATPCEHSEVEAGTWEMFICRRPE